MKPFATWDEYKVLSEKNKNRVFLNIASRRSEIEMRVKEIDEELKKLRAEKELIEYWHARTWNIVDVDGVPIAVSCNKPYGGFSNPVAKRNASIYLNAHNKTTFGMHVKQGDGYYDREIWCGADHKDYEVLKAAAIRYCVDGTPPPGMRPPW